MGVFIATYCKLDKVDALKKRPNLEIEPRLGIKEKFTGVLTIKEPATLLSKVRSPGNNVAPPKLFILGLRK